MRYNAEMKTHKHLFERVCALENILAASREALRNGKRAKPPGARYFAELEKQAVRLRRELLAGTYRHGGYTCFTVHEPKERLRGYVRYVDDFILFGNDRAQLRAHGHAIRRLLAGLRLRIHPDKYRLLPTRLGVDFVGFVSFANGRRRVRTEHVRRFARKLRRLRWEARCGVRAWSEVTLRVRAWAPHAAHGQTMGLRGRLFAARSAAGARACGNGVRRGACGAARETTTRTTCRRRTATTTIRRTRTTTLAFVSRIP